MMRSKVFDSRAKAEKFLAAQRIPIASSSEPPNSKVLKKLVREK
jgi:hypothetical protein